MAGEVVQCVPDREDSKGLEVRESLAHYGELKYVHHVWNIKNQATEVTGAKSHVSLGNVDCVLRTWRSWKNLSRDQICFLGLIHYVALSRLWVVSLGTKLGEGQAALQGLRKGAAGRRRGGKHPQEAEWTGLRAGGCQ